MKLVYAVLVSVLITEYPMWAAAAVSLKAGKEITIAYYVSSGRNATPRTQRPDRS
jgi:hypothetical protein